MVIMLASFHACGTEQVTVRQTVASHRGVCIIEAAVKCVETRTLPELEHAFGSLTYVQIISMTDDVIIVLKRN